MIATLLIAAFVICMIAAMISDIFIQKISNYLPIILLIGFAVMATITGMSWFEVGISLGYGFIAFAVGYVLFLMGGMGAGDVKFMCCTIPWLATSALQPYVFAVSIVSLILIMTIVMARRFTPLSLSERIPFFHDWICNGSGAVPYGVPLGAGGLIAIVETPLFAMVI